MLMPTVHGLWKNKVHILLKKSHDTRPARHVKHALAWQHQQVGQEHSNDAQNTLALADRGPVCLQMLCLAKATTDHVPGRRRTKEVVDGRQRSHVHHQGAEMRRADKSTSMASPSSSLTMRA